MADPRHPRRRAKRAAKEPDFYIDPQRPNATVELETADLMQLGQSGLVEQARAGSRTRELALADLQELKPGNALAPADKVVVDLGPDPDAPREPTVVVDLGPDEPAAIALPVHVPSSTPPLRPGTPMNVQRVTPTMPRLRRESSRHMAAAKRGGGLWLVVLVYVLSATALGISIYDRFVA